MTPASIVEAVRTEFNELNAQESFVGDKEIFSWLWHAEYILADKTNCTESTTALTLTTGTERYSYPSSVMNIIRLEYNGVALKKITLQEKDTLFAVGYGGTQGTGSPTHYYEYGSQVGLLPVPDSNPSCTVYCAVRPIVQTAAATSFTIPEQFHFYLKDFALQRAFAKDGDTALADRYNQQWNNNLIMAQQQWDEKKYWGREERVRVVE